MKPTFARWMIGYGLFLSLVGLLGFLSNPEKAKTALLSGGTFGGLAVVLGVMANRGADWPRKAALALATMLSGVFIWRSSVSWMAVMDGKSEKLVAALLITSMGIASLATIAVAIRALTRPAAAPPQA